MQSAQVREPKIFVLAQASGQNVCKVPNGWGHTMSNDFSKALSAVCSIPLAPLVLSVICKTFVRLGPGATPTKPVRDKRQL